jgi:hypothetical protein
LASGHLGVLRQTLAGDRVEPLTRGWDLMRPLAVTGLRAVCLAIALISSRSASRCSATLLALRAQMSRARPSARPGRHLPVNEAVGRRSSLNCGSYRTHANLYCGIVPGGAQ